MPKESLPPLFTAAWLAATSLCVWFLFVHAPAFLAAKGHIQPLLCIHLIGVYFIYMACVHNTLVTPSVFNGAARPFHVWLGRIGLLLGVIGFVSGVVLVWFIYDFTQNWGFSIGITFGGISQMQAQIIGYNAIRRFKKIRAQIGSDEYKDEELSALQDEQDKQLKVHIQAMVDLFVLACGIPALIRICDTVGYNYLPIFILMGFCLSYFMARAFKKRVTAKRLSERATTNETSLLPKDQTPM